MNSMPERLPPAIRELLEYLWGHLPAVQFDGVPEYLRGAVAWCASQNPQWVRIRVVVQFDINAFVATA